MIIVDKLCYQSKLRYVNPMEKFFFAVITLIMCIVSRSVFMGFAVLVLNRVLTVKIGGISGRRYSRLMLIPLVFLILSTLAIIVNFSHYPLDAFSIPVGNIYITGSWAGLMKAVQLIITAMASVSCLYFLSLNTTMTDIIEVNRKLRCPELIIEMMMLIYRYIFLMLDIAYNIMTSQNARLGNKDMKTSVKSFGAMGQVLFIRSMKRSRALYDAMEARCYDGVINVLTENKALSRRNILLIAVCEMILLAYTIFIKTQNPGGLF